MLHLHVVQVIVSWGDSQTDYKSYKAAHPIVYIAITIAEASTIVVVSR